MEDMKAVYKLNEAKLEFNLQVLNEREKVNTTTKQSLVKRDRKHQETLREYKDRFNKQNLMYKNENIKLTQQYKRITIQFKELQEKFRRFQQSDER